MPTQAIIPVTPGTGLDLDAVSLVIGLNTVYRETMVIADPSNATYLATVTSGGALNVADAVLDACITANVLAVSVTNDITVIGTDADNAANSTTKLPVIPARANASAPSWTEGHEVPLSTDLSGNLRVLATFSGTVSQNLTEWNSVALGSPTAFGTEPSGNVIGVNAEIFQGSSVVGVGNALYVQFPSAQAVTLASTTVTITPTPLTPSSPTAASVGVTSAQALAANAGRLGLVLINTSSNYISLGFGAAAVLYSGVTLNPNGGTYVMDSFTFNLSAVNAIASGASSNLAVQELT